MKNLLITILFLFFLFFQAFATHNRAGEITYKQISGLKFEITVITYTNTKRTSTGQIPADRPQLQVQWGDNTSAIIDRTDMVDLPDDYRKNTYIAQHTYPGSGTFEIVVEDPNRNEGVVNIPNPLSTMFSIKTIMKIDPTIGYNNTPLLLNPPVDKAAKGEIFIHNPAAFDPDGDSISYKLTVCTGENGEPIEGYALPESSNRKIFIDEITGDLIWDSPVKIGIYNIAMFIEEWRYGIIIGRITRDMQIEVYETNNHPPIIEPLELYCVEANTTLSFNVYASDQDNDNIKLTSSGGVYLIDDPAQFPEASAVGFVSSTFTWQTKCNHVRKQPYLVVFKAEDNNDEINLVDIKNVDIYVIGPAPQNLILDPTNNNIKLDWDIYECEQITGYEIYRSTNSYNFTPGDCETGVPSYTGFSLIAKVDGRENNSYFDNNNGNGLSQGYEYCYMITAVFPDGAKSYASEEVCTELIKGIPVLTNVSVLNTDSVNGKMYVAWSKPAELDTILAPGPYKYLIFRSNDLWGHNLELIDLLFEEGLNDTIYYDSVLPLNTAEFPYSYKVELHNQNGLIDEPMIASSIFIDFDASSNKLTLNFNKNVPWINDEYIVYRKNPSTLEFDSIGITNDLSYTDYNLDNNKEYFYKTKSIGKYLLEGFIDPIINFSHENSGIPIDITPPPPPVLNVASMCDIFRNELYWTKLPAEENVIKYNIYYSPLLDISPYHIATINSPDTLFYFHYPSAGLAACYQVTAIDSALNESVKSNKVCIDSCKYYELPNVFTPNNDNINDYFIPVTPKDIIDKFIDKVDFKVFNRWGHLVFETDDPHLNWDGKHMNNNKPVSNGVYFYICDVYEKRLTGSEPRYLTGFIHIYASSENNIKP
ncbi:MAG: gliding motility-associated C-terminal domain-containing protein [Bacteroidales bacterium]|nr:gliding motility-associated C-terminal domain-containing protein [Bacteroidales bacterium]